MDAACTCKFPLVNIEKGKISDAILARYSNINNTKFPGSARNTSLSFSNFSNPGRVQRVQLYDIPLKKPALAFLEDCLANPDDGVILRYKRLSLSIGTGNKIKQQLIDSGWLESQTIETGQTRKLILRPTKQSIDALGIKSQQPQYGSIAHEYWKRYYGQRFLEQGFKVDFEVPRETSGRVDVVAEKDGQKIAIEIETGKSDFLGNIRQDLIAKYDKVIVVATDKKALKKIEYQLAHTGLLISNRVSIELT